MSFVARLILHITQMSEYSSALILILLYRKSHESKYNSYLAGKKAAGAMAPGANNANPGVQQGMPDPIGALQNLARQGTGNNTNMGMQGPGPNPQNMVPQQAPGANNTTNRESLSI